MQKDIYITGFTLIELLLYIAIMGTLLMSVSFFFASSTAMSLKNQSENDVVAQGTNIVEYITNTLRNATAVTQPTLSASASQLTVNVPTAAASPTIFSLTGDTFFMNEGTATAVPLSSPAVKMSNFLCKRLDAATTPASVQCTFTLERSPAANSGDEFTFSTTFVATGTLRR